MGHPSLCSPLLLSTTTALGLTALALALSLPCTSPCSVHPETNVSPTACRRGDKGKSLLSPSTVVVGGRFCFPAVQGPHQGLRSSRRMFPLPSRFRPPPPSLISSAEITACTNSSPNNGSWEPLALSHTKPEFHLKTRGQENDTEQRKARCSSRYSPSLSAAHGSGRCPRDVGTREGATQLRAHRGQFGG